MHRAVLFIPPLSFFLFSTLFNHIYLGIRHILPIYPFFFLFASSVIPAINELKRRRVKQIMTFVLSVFLFWSLGKSFLSTPHQITYFNEFVRNIEQGAGLMPVHAGQDNKRLAEAVKTLNIQEIKIGGGNNNPPEFDYYGLPWAYMTDEDFTNPKPGYYAIDLDVYTRQKKTNQNFWFLNKKPYYIAGKTIYIYKVS